MIVFHTPEGRIEGVVYDPIPDGARDFYCAEGRLFVEAETDVSGPELCDQYYISDGAIEVRPTLPDFDKTEIIANDNDVAVLHDLPDPVTVRVDNEEFEVTGGVLEISTSVAATYLVEIDHFPYMPLQVEIVAT